MNLAMPVRRFVKGGLFDSRWNCTRSFHSQLTFPEMGAGSCRPSTKTQLHWDILRRSTWDVGGGRGVREKRNDIKSGEQTTCSHTTHPITVLILRRLQSTPVNGRGFHPLILAFEARNVSKRSKPARLVLRRATLRINLVSCWFELASMKVSS